MSKEKCKQQASSLMWVLAVGLLFQNLVFPVMARTAFDEQKNYYSPDPHARSPPTGSHSNPPHVPTPSHGGGGSPPTHSTPSTPTPSHGNCGTPPSNPPSGHGGYYPSPPSTPTPTPVTPTPTTPYVPTPTPPTPSTPYVPTPTPPTPSTPNVPSPPYVPDPNSPFTCNYWRTHPQLIWGVLGWWGTLGNAFGVTSLPGFGVGMSLPQALSNTGTDGYGTLYREGTAALLNSMVSNKFPFTTRHVRDSFVSALSSNKAAASQGHLFKLANEGRLKPRN